MGQLTHESGNLRDRCVGVRDSCVGSWKPRPLPLSFGWCSHRDSIFLLEKCAYGGTLAFC